VSPIRDALVATLETAVGIEVVGVGAESKDALRLTQRLRPDVIAMGTLALGPNGLQAIRHIMRTVPTSIIVMAMPRDLMPKEGTGHMTQNDIDYAFEALRAGALTVVNEPVPSNRATYTELIDAVRLMAEVPVIHHWDRGAQAAQVRAVQTGTASQRRESLSPEVWAEKQQHIEIIGIAASTGGPAAMTVLLRNLPAEFPLPIVLVQHVTHGFGDGLTKWLNSQTPLHVRIACDGEQPQAGTVLISPDDYHLQLNRLGKIELNREQPYKGLRPSANFLFRSMACAYGPRAMGIVLTGMGDDGVEGLTQLHQVGGLTIAQDEQSSVVYGMPYEAVTRRAVDRVLALEQIALLLGQLRRAQRLPALAVN